MSAPATERDIHEIATSLPGVTTWPDRPERPIYQVRGKSFVFFRSPRPDAVDAATGERLTDVVVFWVADDGEKQALVDGPGPFFTTPHFNGHRSVLLRLAHIGQLSRDELAEVITDAWLSRAPKRLAAQFQAEHGLPG